MWAVWFISMNKLKHIALVELRFDDLVSASLFGRLLFLWKLKHNKQKTASNCNG